MENIRNPFFESPLSPQNKEKNMENKIKCNGCKTDKMPEKQYDTKTQRPTWFGKYKGEILVEWICIECWDKGVRYK